MGTNRERILALEGRELDRAVADALGTNMPPSREFAMTKVAGSKVCETGSTFKLRDGRSFPVPRGEWLPQPEGSSDWNDRYFFHVAKQLGAEIDGEVALYRIAALLYSTSLDAVRLAELEIVKRGLGEAYATELNGLIDPFAFNVKAADRLAHRMAAPADCCRAILLALSGEGAA